MTRYFWKQGGDDLKDGLSDANAFGTLAKLSTVLATLKPGDRCSLRREGDVFVGQAAATNLAGTQTDPIVLDTYGSGAPPVLTTRTFLSGASTPGNWVDYGATVANTWYLANGNGFNPRRVWLSGSEFFPAAAEAGVNSTNRFFWGTVGGGANRFLVYATSNPASFYSSIESLQNGGLFSTLELLSCSYLVVDGWDVRGGPSASAWLRCGAGTPTHHIVLRNSRFGLDGYTGVYQGRSTSTVCDHIMHQSNRYESGYAGQLGITAQPINVNDGVTFDGSDDCGIDDSHFADWGHSGVSGYSEVDASCSRIKLRRSYFTGRNSEYMRAFGFVGSEGKMTGLEVSDCTIRDTTVRNQISGHNGKYVRNLIERMRNSTASSVGSAQGFDLGASATPLGAVGVCHDNEIDHNGFVDCDEAAIRLRGDAVNSGDKTNNSIRNNWSVNCGKNSKDTLANFQIVVDNHVSVLNNFFENNDLFKSGVTNVVSHKGTAMSAVTWNALDTFINGNISTDPQLVAVQSPTFGNDVPGASSLTGVFTIGRPYVCPGPVGLQIPISALRLFCTGTGAGAFRLAVFNSAGTVKICEGNVAIASVPSTGPTWQGYVAAGMTPNPAFVVGGTTYLLVLTQTAANHTTRYSSGTTIGEYVATDFTAGFPASLPALVNTSPVEPSIRVELDLPMSNVHIVAASPCKDGGVVIAGINDGTLGSAKYVGAAPDIGIYETLIQRKRRSRMAAITG